MGLNRLSKVTTPDGNTVTIDNLTDGFNRLAKSTSTGSTRFLHDGMSVLAEYDSAGREIARYTLGPGTDEIIARKDDSGTYFYHYDGLGSVTGVTDARGKVVATYEYEPFGRQKAAPTSTLTNLYTFTGREWDQETGLYYYRARHYDPMVGRFISKDPISFAGGDVNLYGYVQNNPLNFVDPTGLQTAVIFNGPTDGNPFGHAAIAFTDSGVYSFGNNYPLGGDLSTYLQREAPRRGTTVVTLNTTPAQETIMKNYLLQLKNKPLQKWPDNCAERTSGALQAGGMSFSEMFPTSWPLEVLYQALGWQHSLGGKTYNIPKGSTQLPSGLGGF